MIHAGETQTKRRRNAGDTHFALREGAREKGRTPGAIAFRVDDLNRELERLAGLVINPPDGEMTGTGISRFITFQDRRQRRATLEAVTTP